MSKVTKEQIEAWRKQHGEVYEMNFEDGKSCYLSRPSRKIVGLILAKSAANPLAGAEVVLANCWLGGDDVIKEDAGYMVGIAAKIDQIVGVKTAEIKNL